MYLPREKDKDIFENNPFYLKNFQKQKVTCLYNYKNHMFGKKLKNKNNVKESLRKDMRSKIFKYKVWYGKTALNMDN